MKKHYRNETNCLNCGTELQGKFCQNCGQENLEIKESFGHMMEHAISDYFHFDHQFFHTLKPLFFKPGKLTNEYMAGKRVQYLHPVKMYIFISLIFFILLFRDDKSSPKVEIRPLTTEEANSVKKVFGSVPTIHTSPQTHPASAEKNAGAEKEHFETKVGGHYNLNQYLAEQAKLPAGKRDNFLKRYLLKTLLYYKGDENARETFSEAFKHNAPKMMFLVLPLFALILKISFRRNHKFYVEHLIHSFHLHCFIFLLLAILMLLDAILPASVDDLLDWLQFLAMLVIVWYIYKSLRAVYQRSRLRTVSKMVGISLMYGFALMLCIVVVAAITSIIEVKA